MPIGESFFWRTIEDELSTIGSYYDMPILSLRNAVFHLLREQRFGFQARPGGCSPAPTQVALCRLLPCGRAPAAGCRAALSFAGPEPGCV